MSESPAITVMSARLTDLRAIDVHRIYKLRVDVFVHEQRQPFAEIDDIDAEPTTLHLVAYGDESEEPLGVARVFPDSDEQGALRIGRVCVAAHERGKGVAGVLMEEALEQSDGVFVLDAQEYLEKWYATFGFVRNGENFLDEGIPHVPMRRA